MPHKLTYSLKFTEQKSFMSTTTTTTTKIFSNQSNATVIFDHQSKVQRWIFGMIIGSAPFLIILSCWIFVSLIINNLVRFYQRNRKHSRRESQTNGTSSMLSKTNI